MEIIRGSNQLQNRLHVPIIAVGNFDGVHLGHQTVLKRVVQRVREVGGCSVVYTFEPHPLQVLNPARLEGILTPFSEKMREIERLGVEWVVCEEFNQAFSEQEADTFVREYLHCRLGAREIYVGQNFAFGRGRKGTTEDLMRIGASLGMVVHVEKAVLIQGIAVSSSRIRSLLKEGRVARASLLLGRHYSLEGEVVVGAQRGRRLGYSTANLVPEKELVPKRGVYAVQVHRGGRLYGGIAYIGSSPTFEGERLQVEVHLFEYNENLYHDRIRVAFVDWIREDMTFPGPEALVRQIDLDIQRARLVLRGGGEEVATLKGNV
jgi:riboflavin kinase/FMN adenylyltransferase